MFVDYTVNDDSFVPGKPCLWSDKQIFYSGFSNLALAPDGKRFAVLLTEKIRKGQFKIGKLGGSKATMPEIWRAALAA